MCTRIAHSCSVLTRCCLANCFDCLSLTRLCAWVQYFKYHQVEYELVKLPTREENKSFELVFEIAERLEAFKLNRWAACIALGMTARA